MVTIHYTKLTRGGRWRQSSQPIPRTYRRRVDPARALYWARNIVDAGAADGEPVTRCRVGGWAWSRPFVTAPEPVAPAHHVGDPVPAVNTDDDPDRDPRLFL